MFNNNIIIKKSKISEFPENQKFSEVLLIKNNWVIISNTNLKMLKFAIPRKFKKLVDIEWGKKYVNFYHVFSFKVFAFLITSLFRDNLNSQRIMFNSTIYMNKLILIFLFIFLCFLQSILKISKKIFSFLHLFW